MLDGAILEMVKQGVLAARAAGLAIDLASGMCHALGYGGGRPWLVGVGGRVDPIGAALLGRPVTTGRPLEEFGRITGRGFYFAFGLSEGVTGTAYTGPDWRYHNKAIAADKLAGNRVGLEIRRWWQEQGGKQEVTAA